MIDCLCVPEVINYSYQFFWSFLKFYMTQNYMYKAFNDADYQLIPYTSNLIQGYMNHIWKLNLVLCLLALTAHSAADKQELQTIELPQEYFSHINDYVTGRITMQNQGHSLQNFQLNETEREDKKYLFFKLVSHDLLYSPKISVYDYDKRTMIHQCELKEYDECYMKSNLLSGINKIAVLVSAQGEGTYNLVTYWGNLQHLLPDKPIKFIFGKETNQMFHLELDSKQDKPQQIRIVLEPETTRIDFDNLKIYASFNQDEQPTQQKHDKASIRVWGGSEGLFFDKSQIQGKDRIIIYIVGNANTIYNLYCEFITEDHHDIELNENLHEYLTAGSTNMYHINSSSGFNNTNYDYYALKFSVFKGELAIGLFRDKDGKNKVDRSPFQYMSDQQFIFTKQEIMSTYKDLFVFVYCQDASVVYQIEVQGRNVNQASLIPEDIFEFIMTKNQKKAVAYRYSIFSNDTSPQTKTKDSMYNFDVNTIKAQGNFSLEFYVCVSLPNCLSFKDEKKFADSTKKVPSQQSEVGTKIIHRLEIKPSDFQKSLTIQKQVYIIAMVIPDPKATSYSLVALEFSNPNKIKILREDKAIEEHVKAQEVRFYKFENQEKNIQSIKIHYNHVSGLTRALVTREDPRRHMPDLQKQKQNIHNTFSFTKDEDLTKPFYVTVGGYANSIYVLSVMIQHADHPGSALTLAEDINYPLYIEPMESKIVQIHPIERFVTFGYKSEGGPVNVCEANFYGFCLQQNAEYRNFGQITFDSQQKRSMKIKITNGLSGNNGELPGPVSVNVFYHAQGKQHCETYQVNRLYNQIVNPGSCLKFDLPKLNNLQLLINKQDIGRNVHLISACSNVINPEEFNDRYRITQEQLGKACQSQSSHTLTIYLMSISGSTTQKIPYQFAVAYVHMPLMLIDGVSYTKSGRSKDFQGNLQTFTYELKDVSKNHTIVLLNKKGTQYLYGKIIPNQTQFNTYVKYQMTDIKTARNQTNPTFVITPEAIKNSSCKNDCILFFTVASSASIPDSQYEFMIQVVSSSQNIAGDKSISGNVMEGGFKYYRYSVTQRQNSIYIKASDNNMQCTKIYISKSQFPSPSNMLKSSLGGELIYEKADKDIYYIAVEGLENCAYSLTVSESSAKIVRLNERQIYDLHLKKGEQQLFLIRHIAETPFKILSMERSGSLKISANKTNLENSVIRRAEEGQFKSKDFRIKSQEKNVLVVSKEDPDFCSNCSYLIMVEAVEQTQTSIAFVNEDSIISFNGDKVLNDKIVDSRVSTIISYKTVSDGNITVNVFTGELNLSMSYMNQKQEFTFKQKTTTKPYNFTREQSVDQAIILNVTALKTPLVYSLQIRPASNSTIPIKVSPGQPSYIHLKSSDKECISGFVKSKQDKLFLTTSIDKDYKLESIYFSAIVNGEETSNVKKTIIGNIIELEFIYESIFFSQSKSYEICFQIENQSQLPLTVFQTQNFNILPPNTEALISNKTKYMLHPTGDFFIDLFTCSGETQFKYGESLDQLDDNQSKDIQKLGIPGQNHAIRLESEQPIYIQVTSQKATLNWIPLDLQKQRGVGYLRFNIGGLQYTSSFNQIQFSIGGISRIKETNSQIVSERYTLYITDSKEDLQKAIMCEHFEENVLKKVLNFEKNNIPQFGEIINMTVSKQLITKKFDLNSTLFYNVVLDMILQPPQSESEPAPQKQSYKFIYFEQQVPTELFSQTQLQSTNIGVVTLGIIIAIAGVLGLFYIFVQFVVPAIGRLRNRAFIEQDDDRKDSIPVPASSDRNRVITQMNQYNAQTDEQMN